MTGYKLRLTFKNEKAPSRDDIGRLLADHQLVSNDFKGKTATIIDSLTRTAFSLEIGIEEPPRRVEFDIPYDGPVRPLLIAYSLAQTMSDRFNGTIEDPQLGKVASPFLAKQEWKRRSTSSVLNTAFQGQVPADIKSKLVQRRFMEFRQELAITGDEIEINRKVPFKTEQYNVPILSLGDPQEFTRPNNKWFFLVIFGFIFFIQAALLAESGSTGSAVLQLIGWGMIFSSIPLYWRFRRHLIFIPGYSGNLLLDASSPSSEDVRRFLDSVERVSVALARYRLPVDVDQSDAKGVV